MNTSKLSRPFEIRAVTEEGKIEGYGSVFHVEDWYSDIVMPGAFAKSLTQRTPKMLWQHYSDMPIGVWSKTQEDKKGLYLEGQIALGTQSGREAYELLKMGALDGLSIGFTTKRYEFDKETETRKLLEVELWEVSPVTFPANEEARVEGVKDMLSVREIEIALRDAGFSRERAKTFLAELRGRRDAGSERRDAVRDEPESLEKLLSMTRSLRVGG